MNRYLFIFGLWLAVWPIVTGVSWILTAIGPDWPLALRTLATSVILVPTMVLAVVPGVTRILTPRAMAD